MSRSSPGSGSLATDFLLRLVGVQFGALILAIVLLVTGYSFVVSNHVRSQAAQFMDAMLAVREYTSRKVNPILAPINSESDTEFYPEAVPSYSAQKVSEYLKLNSSYADFSYREASLNPTSPADQATKQEAELIRQFINDSSLRSLSGELDGQSDHEQFFLAKPIRLTKKKCLTCHSTPAAAPRSQLVRYGTEGGFGWKLGDVVGIQIATLPINSRFVAPTRFVILLFLVVAALVLLITMAINRFFDRLVLIPLRKLVRFAEDVSYTPEEASGDLGNRDDEMGSIARSFERLRHRLTTKVEDQ